MWLLSMVVDMFSRRPAAEKPPLSTTRANAVSPVSRSTRTSDYPVLVDNHFLSWRIIQGATEGHLPRVLRWRCRTAIGKVQEMTNDRYSVCC